jgi:hypothetical protein
MKRIVLRGFVAVFAAAALAACVMPVYNVKSAPVETSSGTPPTMADVEQAIVRAGQGLGWRMQPVKPGHVVGTLSLRTHTAVVDVTFDTRTYNITYKDSMQLNYDGTNIHKNYNGWIQNLDFSIRNNLRTL